jgi:uncharacterized damage-inducible protein DinB
VGIDRVSMQEIVRKHLLRLLEGGDAHLTIEEILEKVPAKARNAPIEGLPYSIWELLEHIRICQKDILDYMTDPNYTPGEFPQDYWPKPDSRMNWSQTVKGYREDLKQMKALLKKVNPLDQLPYGEKGHTYLREVLILAEHLSYHLGQMMILARLSQA